MNRHLKSHTKCPLSRFQWFPAVSSGSCRQNVVKMSSRFHPKICC
nr:MAG TPA: Bcl-2-like protein [Caudoviricetes sp.]